jgi:hypothetical protein
VHTQAVFEKDAKAEEKNNEQQQRSSPNICWFFVVPAGECVPTSLS